MVDPEYWENLLPEEKLMLWEALKSEEIVRLVQYHVKKYQEEIIKNYSSSTIEDNTEHLALAFRDLEVWTSIGELLNKIRLTPRAIT